jgi:hypothetical protein
MITVLLLLTSPLLAMNGFLNNGNLDLDLLNDKGIIIINTKKTKKEPSCAFLKRSNGPCLKIYKGVFKENNFFKEIIKNVNSVEIDYCEIEKITAIPGIRMLTVTHCHGIKEIDITFNGSLVSLNISHNRLNKNAYEQLLKIEKNENVIINDNVLIEDNLNN